MTSARVEEWKTSGTIVMIFQHRERMNFATNLPIYIMETPTSMRHLEPLLSSLLWPLGYLSCILFLSLSTLVWAEDPRPTHSPWLVGAGGGRLDDLQPPARARWAELSLLSRAPLRSALRRAEFRAARPVRHLRPRVPRSASSGLAFE